MIGCSCGALDAAAGMHGEAGRGGARSDAGWRASRQLSAVLLNTLQQQDHKPARLPVSQPVSQPGTSILCACFCCCFTAYADPVQHHCAPPPPPPADPNNPPSAVCSPQVSYKEPTPPDTELVVRSHVVAVRENQNPGLGKAAVEVDVAILLPQPDGGEKLLVQVGGGGAGALIMAFVKNVVEVVMSLGKKGLEKK